MVYFCCDGCGETLKKAQVDQHARRCRQCASVSCVDCSVSFWGDTYRQHTSCLSEAERYEKTVYRGVRKGDVSSQHAKKNPQDAWTDLIARAAATATDPALQSKLQELTHLDNVPRKEKQFRNFTANSLNLKDYGNNKTNSTLVEKMWKYLVEVREAEREQRQTAEDDKKKRQQEQSMCTIVPSTGDDNDDNDDAPSHTARTSQETTIDATMINEKKVAKAMKKILKKAPKQQLKMKELREKVKIKLSVHKARKNELKKIMVAQIGEHGKKLKIDGKMVSLITVE